ncbi:MAG: hypothetical protein B7Z16_08775 [Algoriphagus sp. 32-45-6]|jgi:peroxiredoxin|nr:MAG: hypothetical protein B7Z16_08775 [Algoriphagus sp. 32-45-6]
MRKYFFLSLLLSIFCISALAQVKTTIVPDQRKVRVDEQLYNKQTGEKMTGEQLYHLLQERPGISLETIYNRYGEPEKFYYDPENPFFKKNKDPNLRPQVGQEFPLFSFRDIQGQLHHAEELRGGWVVLYFYPILEAIREKDWSGISEQIITLEESGVKIKGFGVFATSKDPVPVVGQYQEQITLVNSGQGFFDLYHLTEFPATYVIDPEGKIVASWNSSDDIDLPAIIQERN